MGTHKARLAKSSLFTQYDIWLDQNRIFRVAYDKNGYKGDQMLTGE